MPIPAWRPAGVMARHRAGSVTVCKLILHLLHLTPRPLISPSSPKIPGHMAGCLNSTVYLPAASTRRNFQSVNLHTFQSSFHSLIKFQCLQLRCNKRQVKLAAKSLMATESVSDDRMLVFVPPHPLIKHWISVLRNEQTPCPIFKNAMAELGRLLIYEASRDWLPTINGEIQSPMGVASVEFIDPREPVTIVPILRAGLVLAEHVSSILPATKTYHVGVCRDEKSLQPMIYLNKLPDNIPEGSRVLVTDPMLATGGTIVAVIDLLKDRGVGNKQIKVVSAVAAPPALQKLSERFPGLHVYTGIIDPTVNDKGFIIPGLGDAGDRSFGT